MKKSIKKPTKSTFDKDAFVFSTDVERLEQAIKERLEELEDLREYQQPDADQRKRINDLCYWIGVWEIGLPEAKRRGMKTVPTSARENAILGLFDKPKPTRAKKK